MHDLKIGFYSQRKKTNKTNKQLYDVYTNLAVTRKMSSQTAHGEKIVV